MLCYGKESTVNLRSFIRFRIIEKIYKTHIQVYISPNTNNTTFLSTYDFFYFYAVNWTSFSESEKNLKIPTVFSRHIHTHVLLETMGKTFLPL